MSDEGYAMNDRPIGKRFSLVYLDRSKPKQDSRKARRRIAEFIRMKTLTFVSTVRAEMGLDVRVIGRDVDWYGALESWELSEVLDVVTLVYENLGSKGQNAQQWVETARRIFDEENLPYTVDDQGGVHFKMDAEFVANVEATVSGLASPRYANVRKEFETAQRAMVQAKPDGKQAIRSTFTAIEGLYKLICSDSAKLDAKDAGRKLEPIIQRVYANDPTARRASAKLLAGFADWVDGAHFYRHEQGSEDPAQPPIELAVEFMALGATYLRWLIVLDGN
jgi:hypothetical protein